MGYRQIKQQILFLPDLYYILPLMADISMYEVHIYAFTNI